MGFPLQPLVEYANGVVDTNGNFYPYILTPATQFSDKDMVLPVAPSNIRYYIRTVWVDGTAMTGYESYLTTTILGQSIVFAFLRFESPPGVVPVSMAQQFDTRILCDTSVGVQMNYVDGHNQFHALLFAAVDVRGANQ